MVTILQKFYSPFWWIYSAALPVAYRGSMHALGQERDAFRLTRDAQETCERHSIGFPEIFPAWLRFPDLNLLVFHSLTISVARCASPHRVFIGFAFYDSYSPITVCVLGVQPMTSDASVLAWSPHRQNLIPFPSTRAAPDALERIDAEANLIYAVYKCRHDA
jgi:hypothetical protein